MKIASLKWQERERVGVVDAAAGMISVKDLHPDDVWRHPDTVQLDLIGNSATLAEISLAEAELLPPVPRPAKLLCIAANYYAHMQESGRDEDVEVVRPQFFMKPPTTCLIGHKATFRIPSNVGFLDYEAELAVVIGKRLYQAKDLDEALGAVAGYTAFNDLSERAMSFDPRHDKRSNMAFFDWLTGKWLNGSAPAGPWVTTADEIPDPQDLTIELRLNGKVMQSASTALMMSPVADIVWYGSQFMTLEPGDIIATGTPAGVGKPQGVFLKPGDTTEVTIDKIGSLITHFRA